MWISPAFAQEAASGGTNAAIMQMLPLVLIFAVFYFLLLRPQQKRAKELKASLSQLKRGDKVITAGGILGKITKPAQEGSSELEVEIAEGVRVMVLRDTISGVINPQPANDAKPTK